MRGENPGILACRSEMRVPGLVGWYEHREAESRIGVTEERYRVDLERCHIGHLADGTYSTRQIFRKLQEGVRIIDDSSIVFMSVLCFVRGNDLSRG